MPIKMKIYSDLKSVFTSMRFPVAKMSEAQWGRDRNVDKIRSFLLHMANHIFFTERIVANYSSSLLRCLALSCTTHTRQLVASKLSYKHDILWYILFRLFFLPVTTSSHTLGWFWSIALDLNILEQVSEAKQATLRKPLWTGHLSTTNTILRSRWCPL